MFKAQDVARHVLPNGLTLLARHDATAPVVAIVTYVRAGYFDEPDEVAGIAHVLEHMFFKGTATRGVGEIARQTKSCGGYLNASTIYDHTRYYAVVPASSFAAGLEIQADAYANAALDAGELARELEVIIEEARRKADTPEAVTTETLFELLHDRHRIRRWRIGRPDGLRALRREHLHAFYRRYYQPSNTLLSIVGDVPVAEMVRAVERLYGSLSPMAVTRDVGPAEATPPRRRFRALQGDISHAHGAFGWRTPGALHDDSVPLDLAASVLASGRSSRLYRAVRERRLASGISAWNYTPGDLGVFVTQWSGDAEQGDHAARATWSEVMRLGDGIADAEVDRARRLHEAHTMRRLESMDGQANYLADWESLGGWELGAAYDARVAASTAREVTAAVGRHLRPDGVSWMRYDPTAAHTGVTNADEAFRDLDEQSGPSVGAAASSVVASGPAHLAAVREGGTDGMRVYRAPTNLPMLIRSCAGAPMVHLAVYAAGGATAEGPGQEGLTTLMVRTAVKGTRRRDAMTIAAESEMLGGSISASVGSDGMGWALSVPASRFAEALDLLADVVTAPAFDEAALETEREIALQQLAQLRDDMYRYPSRLALTVAFAGHAYGRPVAGSEAGLRAATSTLVRGWHQRLVLSGDVVVAVTGDVPADACADMMAGAFGAIQRSDRQPVPAPQWGGKGDVVFELRDKSQTAMLMAFPGPGRADPARHAAHLLSAIVSGLGGRFFDELREKRSLAYTVHAGPMVRATAGAFTAYIATSPAREDEAREGLLREFARLREEPVTAAELDLAKRYVVGTHAIAQQGPGYVLNEMIDAWMHGAGLAELARYDAQLQAVTATDIQQLAQRYFDPAVRAEGVVRGR